MTNDNTDSQNDQFPTDSSAVTDRETGPEWFDSNSDSDETSTHPFVAGQTDSGRTPRLMSWHRSHRNESTNRPGPKGDGQGVPPHTPRFDPGADSEDVADGGED